MRARFCPSVSARSGRRYGCLRLRNSSPETPWRDESFATAVRQAGTPLGLRGVLPRWHEHLRAQNPRVADEAKMAGHHAGPRMVMLEQPIQTNDASTRGLRASTSGLLLVHRLEIGLSGAAVRADPSVGNVRERGAGSNAGLGVAFRWIIDMTANRAPVLFCHCEDLVGFFLRLLCYFSIFPRTMMLVSFQGFLRSSICKSPSLLMTSCAAGYKTPPLFFMSWSRMLIWPPVRLKACDCVFLYASPKLILRLVTKRTVRPVA